MLVACTLLPGVGMLHAQEYLTQGNQHYQNGEYTKAITAYRKAVENRENPALAWFNCGNAWYQLDSIHKAIPCYKAAVVEEPGFVRAWQNLGMLYYEQQDYGGCIAALEHVLSLGEKNNTVLTILGAAHKDLEQYSDAAVYMEQAIERDSSIHDAYLMLYDIARATGDTKEALYWLQRYPQSGSRYYDVLLIKGELLTTFGDTAAALAAYRKSTALKPDRQQAWSELITLMHRMGATYSALLEAEKALTQVKNPVYPALLAGRIAFEAGYYPKAEQFYLLPYEKGHADGVTGLSNLLLAYRRYNDVRGMQRITRLLHGAGNEVHDE